MMGEILKKILLILIFSLVSLSSHGVEVEGEYRNILIKHAYAALHEFYFLNHKEKSKFKIKKIEKAKAVVLSGKDKINRTIYVVLFQQKEGSAYVSMILNNDKILEQHGRGGINIAPPEFENNFSENLHLILSFPSDV